MGNLCCVFGLCALSVVQTSNNQVKKIKIKNLQEARGVVDHPDLSQELVSRSFLNICLFIIIGYMMGEMNAVLLCGLVNTRVSEGPLLKGQAVRNDQSF